MQTLNKQDLTELSWRNNAYNAKFSVKTFYNLVLPWKIRISSDYNCLHTIVTITADKVFYTSCSKTKYTNAILMMKQ